MLQVFFGSDQIKVRKQAHFAIEANLTSDKEFIRLEPDTYEEGSLLSASSSVSLFSSGTVYLLDSPDLEEVFWADFLKQLEYLSSSSNLFIVIFEKVNAADKKVITKFSEVLEEYKKTAEASFSSFKMADALAVRDKRTLWLLFQEAKENGLSSEEIIGTLWWQLKSIRLAAATNSFEEAGMKEYPYKKAKSALRTFPLLEVERKSLTLLQLYHDGHRGKKDLDLALEEWVLTL